MLSEIFRAGLNAVPKGQMEAGLSTGLTYVESMRTIVLPQAFKSMIPAIEPIDFTDQRYFISSNHFFT